MQGNMTYAVGCSISLEVGIHTPITKRVKERIIFAPAAEEKKNMPGDMSNYWGRQTTLQESTLAYCRLQSADIAQWGTVWFLYQTSVLGLISCYYQTEQAKS